MSEAPRRSHFDTRFQQLVDELRHIESVIVADASDRLENKKITEVDGDEYAMGIGYLNAALERLLAEADYVYRYAPSGKQDVLRILPHARALIASALIIGRHSGTTETAKHLLRGEQTVSAVQGKKDKKNERAERVRDIIEAADRRSDDVHKLLDFKAVLEAVSGRLRMPQLDRKTLLGYVAYIDGTRKNDVPPA